MKLDADSGDEKDFMPGKYCILKKDDCPIGFKDGWIYWDDAARLLFPDTVQSYSGDLPDGDYNSNTKIIYCCRDDGNVWSSIKLPTDEPFFLLKNGPYCQQVENMDVTEEWMLWVDESTVNLNQQMGFYPHMERGQQQMPHTKLFYCYYTPGKGGDSSVSDSFSSSSGLQTLIVAAYVVGATVGFVLMIAIILTAIQRFLLLQSVRAERSAVCHTAGSSRGRHTVTALPSGSSSRGGSSRGTVADQPPSYDVALLDSTTPPPPRDGSSGRSVRDLGQNHARVLPPSGLSPGVGAAGSAVATSTTSGPQLLTMDDVLRPPSYDDVIHEKLTESRSC
jgi:hypothetical protein